MKHTIFIVFFQFFLTNCTFQFNADHVQEGIKLLTDGDIQGAIGEFEYAIFLDPSNAEAYRGLIHCYISTEDYEKAFLNADKYIEYKPESFLPYSERGMLYMMTKQYNIALKDFNTALFLDSNQTLILAFNKGECLRELNRYNESIDQYNIVIKKDSTDRRAIFKRGLAKFLNNKIEEACLDYKKASEMGDKDAVDEFEKKCK